MARRAAWKRSVPKRWAASTQAAGSIAIGSKRGNHVRQRGRIALAVVGARLALLHALEHAAGAQRDHRPAGGQRLDGGDPELLGGGDDERLGAAHQLRHLGVAEPAGERHGRAGEPPQPPRLGPVADHHERQPQPVEGLDGDVDPLVRHQLGHHQVVLADLAGREPLELDRRVQHVGLAAEVAAHARRR